MTIAGIEGIHKWTEPGGTEPAIELGRVKADDGSPVWPRFVLDRIGGLGSVGEGESNRDRPPGGEREILRRSERWGRTLVYEGRIQARTLRELRDAEAEFRAAFDDTNGEGRIDVSWHPLLATFEDVPPKFVEAQALTADIADVQDSRRFERAFVVSFRQGDRRYFDEESETHTVEVKDTNTTYDLMALSLPDNVRGPILDLALPATILQVDITLRNATTGKTLTLVLPEDWNGDDLTLDWFRRTVKDQTGANRSALLDPLDNGLWTDPSPFLPGANDLEIEANGGAVIATDSYEQSAGSLTGKTTGTGAKTYEAAGGSDADDFTIDTVNDKAQRTAVSDASADAGRGVLLGAGVYKGTKLRATFGYSTLRTGHRQSLLARAADLSNCLRLDFWTEAFAGETAGIACRLLKRKAGVSTTIANPAVVPSSTTVFPSSVTLGLEVRADGTWKVSGPAGSAEGAADADLKSGAALDDGRVGVYDAWTSATAATRTVDNLRAIDLDSAGTYGAKATLRWEKGYY